MNDKGSKDEHFNASMPLPSDDPAKGDGSNDSANAAADLIRQKVQAAYSSEPSVSDEIKDASQTTSSSNLSKHQKFIYELTSSGKSLPEIQETWHEYYAGLPDPRSTKSGKNFTAPTQNLLN
jgi:hypothetical protein